MVQRKVEFNWFTRQETLKLTSCTSSRLSYLEKVGLIIPTRIGNNFKPTVVFTWEQLLAIRIIKRLREDTSLQTVRIIVQFLESSGCDQSHQDKQLIVFDDKAHWVSSDWRSLASELNLPSVPAGAHTLLICPSLSEVIQEIWDAAKNSDGVDFESFKERAKANPPLHP